MRRLIVLAASAALLCPAAALACSGGFAETDTSMSDDWHSPTVAEIEEAIEAAAQEFGIPESLLQAVAHTESRWQHRPYRISQNGRRGLFQLSPERLALAAELLGLDLELLHGDVAEHSRAFAVLLDLDRPETKTGAEVWDVGLWRDTTAWALDLPPDFADHYLDRLLILVAEGLIDRLPGGEPIAVLPAPVGSQYLGLAPNSVERSDDYPGAAWNPAASCNYTNASRSTGDVDVVIIHTAQGYYEGTIGWFQNCSAQVSAHYVVSTTGLITQMVDEADIGWHVSCWNSFSIGIEHEGFVADPALWYTDSMYAASAALTADILDDWGLPADRDHVMGHVEIDSACNGNGHTDPGTGWDWDYYMALVGGTNNVDLTELVGYVRHTDLYEADFGIPGATVSIAGVGSTSTSSSGYYEFDSIAPGTYTVCAEAAGYSGPCIEKLVEADITNWGSVLLHIDSGDDDDDDDAADDDDDATADDDDTEEPSSDDDDAVAADDDDDDEEAVVGGSRRRAGTSAGRGCAASHAAPQPESSPSLALLLLAGAAAWRRRRLHP